MSFTITVDVINFHPKLNNAIRQTKTLKDSLKAYMDREIVDSGGGTPTYKFSTDVYMASLDAALIAYEQGASSQETLTLNQSEADALYYEKVALDAEIAALEADPDITDITAVPAYIQMKLRQSYLEDAYQQLLTQGYVPTPAPVADFSGSPLSVVTGEPVAFTDLTTNLPTAWNWTFEGGNPPQSQEQNPLAITFDTAGLYDVTLQVSSPAGEDTETKTDYITVTDPLPIADFIADQTNINIGNTVNFTDLSIGSPTSWTWTFPGGTPSSSVDQNPSVVYNTAGVYDVTLEVVNSVGSSAPETKVAYIVVTDPTPVAEFTSDDNTVEVGGTINFTDLSTNAPTSWAWTFNGGTPASDTVQNPSVVYNTVGVYDVTLIATNAEGSSAPETKVGFITVVDPVPVADFSASQTNFPAGGTAIFTDLSTNTPTSWAWTFPGGTPSSSNDQNPSIVYSTPGVYDVTLTATNATGSSIPETRVGYITVT